MVSDEPLSDPRTYARGIPHARFASLRAASPVAWQPDAGGYWAVTSYAAVEAVLRAPERFSSELRGCLLADPPDAALPALRIGMMHKDPPDHTRLRATVARTFTPRRVAQLDERVSVKAREIVDGVRARGACDFATDVAGELPLFLICELLGVPASARAALVVLAQRMLSPTHPDPAQRFADGAAAAAEMRAYGLVLRAEKRAAPGDDLVSELDELADAEFAALFQLLFNAGADNTRSASCFALDLLLDRPDAIAALRADPTKLGPAIEEALRVEPPTIQFRRTAVADTELAGTPIRALDKVVVFFPAANRDPAEFPAPDTVDLARRDNRHLSFGMGVHYCLGAPLARLELRALLGAVLALPELRRAGPLVEAPSNFVRNVRSLPIAFGAAA